MDWNWIPWVRNPLAFLLKTFLVTDHFFAATTLMARNPQTLKTTVAFLLCTIHLSINGQVSIPRNLPFVPELGQDPVLEQQITPKDFRSIDFEVGPTSNRSSMLMEVGQGFNTNLDLDAFELPFFDRGLGLDEADISLGPFGINFHQVKA